MTTATLTRPRRAPRRPGITVSGWRCDALGHPLLSEHPCDCGGRPVRWTAEMTRDLKRCQFAADEAAAGRLGYPLEQLPDKYDRERWMDTSPGDLALALSYCLRWPPPQRVSIFGEPTRKVFVPATYETEDGRTAVDCRCGLRCAARPIDPNTPDGAGYALMAHLDAVSLAATGGRNVARDVPGHTRRRDALATGPEGRAHMKRAETVSLYPGHVPGRMPPLEFVL